MTDESFADIMLLLQDGSEGNLDQPWSQALLGRRELSGGTPPISRIGVQVGGGPQDIFT